MSLQDKIRREQRKEEACEAEADDARVTELEDRLLRQRAEFENYRKQLDREKEEFSKCANEKLIIEMLNIADDLERAVQEYKKKDPEAAEGIELIHRNLMKILERYGVKHIESVGKKFDPYSHEAFLQQESEGPEGVVLEELQKGYRVHDRVIRHSKVKVSKNSNSNEENKNG